MSSSECSELRGWLSATLAADARGGIGALPAWIAARQVARTCVGRAQVLTVTRDDNAALRTLLDGGVSGDVLVIGGASESVTACCGDLLARELQGHGIAALVTDGLVRDAAELRRIGFDVWSRGTCAAAPAKATPGVVGGHTVLGGVIVFDGDLVIADDDGVVIWPRDAVCALTEKAARKRDEDGARLARLRAGGDGHVPPR